MREENLRPLLSFSVVGGGGDDATDKNRQITLKNWLITIHTFFSLCLEIRGEGGRRRRTRLTRLTRNYYTSCCCCYHTAAAAAPTAVSRVWRQDPHRPLPRSRSTSPFCCTKKRKLLSKFKQWLKKNNTFLICFLYSKIAWRIKRIGTFFGPRFEFFLKCSMTLLQVSGGGGSNPMPREYSYQLVFTLRLAEVAAAHIFLHCTRLQVFSSMWGKTTKDTSQFGSTIFFT